MTIPEPTYEDSIDPLVVTCTRCTDGSGRPLTVTGGVRGTRDARSILKELKAHVDAVHGDWSPQMPAAISQAIGRINSGEAVNAEVLARFGLRRRY
jgi:hypothetical protein